MRDALFAAKRPVVFSICEWGNSKPWEWAGDVGHLWRTTGDISACYDCVQRWERGWKIIVDLQYSMVQPADGQGNGIGKFAGPGRWNDPDMLEVGRPELTFAESRAHFSMWCILAAPLMAGADIRHVSPEILAIMTDKEALAIDQDPAGKEGWRFRAEPGREIWVRELGNGDWAVALLNTGDKPADLAIDFHHMWFLAANAPSATSGTRRTPAPPPSPSPSASTRTTSPFSVSRRSRSNSPVIFGRHPERPSACRLFFSALSPLRGAARESGDPRATRLPPLASHP
jgi:hypothetical protein